jgi:hypothetical protein
VFGRLAGFDRAGQLDGPAEKQQFFRERCLPRVWMADDPEGAPAFNFFLQLLAQHNPISNVNGCIRSPQNYLQPVGNGLKPFPTRCCLLTNNPGTVNR